MGKQSARLYYNGKDHKDIYYNGKYHNAIYFKDQGGIIWQKLPDSITISGCCINTNNEYANNIGINTIYPISRELSASIVSNIGGNSIFDTLVSGKNRAFGFISQNYQTIAWVSQDGRYWKKIYTNDEVRYVYPCSDGFMYVGAKNNIYKVTIDAQNNKIEEKTIYENLSIPGNIGLYGKYKSHNGVWAKDETKIQFLNQGGILLEYDFGNGSSATIDFTFESNNKNYAYISGMLYDENFGGYFTQNAIVSCDEMQIVLEAISGADVGGNNYWIKNALNIVEKENEFYFYKNNGGALQVSKTSDFITEISVSEWRENDYIQLNLIGGPVSDYLENIINVIRFYPYSYESQQQNSLYYDIEGNSLNIRWNVRLQDKYVAFTGITLNDYGIFMESSKNYTVIGILSKVAIWLDNTVITKETSGFAYFTDNIGVGVSYP